MRRILGRDMPSPSAGFQLPSSTCLRRSTVSDEYHGVHPGTSTAMRIQYLEEAMSLEDKFEHERQKGQEASQSKQFSPL